MTIATSIIPEKPRIFPATQEGSINYPAAAVFAATGFFLEKDAWFKGQSALQPACNYDIDEQGKISSETPWWKWHYSPRDITLKQATEEFAHLFEGIVQQQTTGKRIILPLSGGLDSRTLAAALRGRKEVTAFSYEFPNGIPETQYGRAIAHAMGFPFHAFTIPEGYLWKSLDELAAINGCYAEFTHPRQMAFMQEYASMGDIFLLGHWGDVLFDDMGVPDNLTFDQQVAVVLKKIIKKGGGELGLALWQCWGLEGVFNDYLRCRIKDLLVAIGIENANAQIRAFKSLYWAPRWTSVNLQVFATVRPIALPYYHDDICRFICTIPEHLLAGRQIQIEYLKMKSPELARIPWQAHKPFNLYNYSMDRSPWNLPYRVTDKFKRMAKSAFWGQHTIQRNWELQFVGYSNASKLREYLLESPTLQQMIPVETLENFWDSFWKKDSVQYAHPLSMLLTISAFSRQKKTEI